MVNHKLDHRLFSVHQDDSGNLYVHDKEEELIFVRGNIGHDRYDLSVIIDEDNTEYCDWTYMFYPDTPCGFQVLDEISLKEWNNLVRNYVRHKCKGEKVFIDWLRKELYRPLSEILYESSWIAESMPWPDAPKKYWKDYDRSWKIFRGEHDT